MYVNLYHVLQERQKIYGHFIAYDFCFYSIYNVFQRAFLERRKTKKTIQARSLTEGERQGALKPLNSLH